MVNNSIREVLQKVCAALNKHNVDFIMVGGIAVGFYGYQRFSAISIARPEMKTDLDFWYNPTVENYLNLLKALNEISVDTSKLEAIVFDPQKTFLKIPHKFFHTDFLPQMEGLKSFRESKKNSTVHLLDGNQLYIISYGDLILNKKAINRDIDKSDVEELERNRNNEQKHLTMERHSVDSPMAISVGYDPVALTLEIEFRSGEVWQYHQVPEHIYFEMKSGSIGGYFQAYIKGQYPESRVR